MLTLLLHIEKPQTLGLHDALSFQYFAEVN